MWYPNGKRKIEGNYLEGKKHGLSTMWHLNGAKWKEQTHQDGKPSGTWRIWNDNGELQESIDHGSAVEK
jgi:antitoxin component YwqK of YwqJK toxin-antitoxin module